uniref:S1-like domain-containing protein n=1 Tax=viral metagenome TaxID=1070528 RepID=A0A6C0J6G7_9ZZZZ
MPKGGGKSKGACKTGPPPRNLAFVDTDDSNQYYARIERILGNCRVKVVYYGKSSRDDGVQMREIVAQVRKRRGLDKLKLRIGGFAIISLRDFEDDKADVIHTYRENEEVELRKRNALPTEIVNSRGDDEEEHIVFDGDSETIVRIREHESGYGDTMPGYGDLMPGYD